MSKRRIRGILWLFFGVFLLLAGYLGWLCRRNPATAVGNGQGQYAVTVASVRGTIYDRAMRPLVNQEKEYRAVLLPDTAALAAVQPVMERQAYLTLLNGLSEGVPAVARLMGPTSTSTGLALFHVPVRYGGVVLAPHLIGHLDGSGTKGLTGLEAAYQSLLENFRGVATVSIPVNGAGDYLAGESFRRINTLDKIRGGVITTLDRDIQEIIESVFASHAFFGAAVVLNPESGEILACASTPTYHPESVAESLNRDDGSLVNRALSLYDCGSVFKTVTAAAALECGVPVTREYTCNGSILVGSTRFHCHQRTLGHQALTMEQAYAASCNVYFIQLAQEIGGAAILNMASRLGLADSIPLAEGLSSPACVLPSLSELSVPAALANLSFGQGKLLLSPLHISRVTATIANGGVLPEVTLVMGSVDESGTPDFIENGEGERVLSKQTASQLRKMMGKVVTEGTGKKAQPAKTTAAGKTGTAQTGQYTGETPVVQSWFTGYFPAENPQFIITVLVEDSDTCKINASEIFCEISNNLMMQKKEE